MGWEAVTMTDCASGFGIFEVEGSKGATYTVTFQGEGAAHCTCPAYRYSGPEMHCKHITQVYEGGCFYNPQYNDGTHNPVHRPKDYTYTQWAEGEECPACGGPMVYVKRAV